jgi:hypothetical protein
MDARKSPDRQSCSLPHCHSSLAHNISCVPGTHSNAPRRTPLTTVKPACLPACLCSDDEDAVTSGEVEIVSPRHMLPSTSSPPPTLQEPSVILDPSHLAALCGALPARFKLRKWQLVYSTSRHGTSLATLYRKASQQAPCVLVVRDSGGHVFGAFTPEAWRIAPRFYGTGETFVFQLEPHKVLYPWKVKSRVKNEYFMYRWARGRGLACCLQPAELPEHG